MEIVIEAITEVVKYLVSPFMDHINYLVYYKTYANDLRKQMASLGELKADVQRSVDAARLRGDVIKVVGESWLSKVNQIEPEETTLHNELEESKGCFQRGCSLRYRVGKDAKRMIDEVKELLNKGQSFDAVSDPAPLPPGLESMQTLDFHVYDSTKLATDKIVEALMDEGVSMVGVYGIGGVGKTTMMKEVAKKMKKDGLFDQVVMVTVAQEPVLKKIQGEIAENLGLPLSEEYLEVRARCLTERLKKEKILIVLDDLWKPLNSLEKLGIPCESNCKVVLTTRQLDVCIQMGTQSNVELKVLSEGDAWALFKWAAGDCLAENNNVLGEVANQVVRECGGLPLAIVTIGRALRAKDLYVWTDAASQLKMSSSSSPDIEGVHEKVFCSIKLSYDFLASEATKFCFLLCCMFPEDFPISEDDLLPYVVGEGVFEDIGNLKDARNRLHMHMERLKSSCLLLNVGEHRNGSCVRMHDVIRDVSIWIASKEGHDFVVKSGRGLTHFPEVDRDKNLRKCKRLSLMQNEITKLPLEYCSDQLMTLSLRDNVSLREIPDGGFFQGMTSLKTLDLVNTGIYSIPSSLSCLTDLRVLCISDWSTWDHEPFDVSLVGKLKKLEILQVQNSNVIRLSNEIGELTNLKSLDLSWNKSMSIAPNILSRLSLLEELNLEGSFHEWEIEGGGSKKEEEDDGGILSKKACCCLSEVTSLSSLTRLKIKVSNIKCLGSANNIPFRFWKNLTHFSIILGNIKRSELNDDLKECATVVVICGASIICGLPNNNPLLMLERTEGLQLNACRGDAVSNLGAKVLNNLRILHVEKCDDMEYLLNTIPQVTFGSLETLYLRSSHKLKAIIMCNHGSSLPSGCFNNLRFLQVDGCHGLISIIPSDLLAKLSNLEELRVSYCNGATEVLDSKGLQLLLDDEGQAEATILLPKLKQLKLSSLRSLRTIWDEGVVPLNLEEIEVSNLRLKFIFSLAMVQRLQQLQRLYISSCDKVVEIISLMEGDDTQRITSSSSSSRLLQLNNNNPSSSSSSVILPTPSIFGNLRSLEICYCHRLTHILPMSLAQGLQQLKFFHIYFCPNLEEIIQNDHHHDMDVEKENATIIMCKKKTTLLLFPSLETLYVRKCPKLKRLTPAISTATKLREINVEEEWFNALEWDDQNEKLQLQERVKVIFI
ncbi:probable disease resistance protein At4g27220 [Macadamia integrifolia]|uniref:probable disease resistance protein At4g27220 n=1 Tax=Macadamia integrifolia TaxID=60698 RepID=UPI001C52A36F|nr:probable disease resistance protein At4g27220 [Macadamia integrifolia]XP_042480775.1 probable disease resistance protein At4g27220 [Macadamia integrifolia]XP_042480776.1 probable disease resistance protein At4g27220 [Macadamia integrifolia]XP_042480777.1 probable disease resistance protein At4g27220 [Macadamia integrifolia]XP_042480779.1 probable disease resistance protein At4g27220 [Macadamia integrifolia]XP_042480780.1 probable disease resistance protein At4g27220 [Macadamia integrifolia]